MNPGPDKPQPNNMQPDSTPKGALMIVGAVFLSIMALWFLVLGVLQARA